MPVVPQFESCGKLAEAAAETSVGQIVNVSTAGPFYTALSQ